MNHPHARGAHIAVYDADLNENGSTSAFTYRGRTTQFDVHGSWDHFGGAAPQYPHTYYRMRGSRAYLRSKLKRLVKFRIEGGGPVSYFSPVVDLGN